MFASWHTVLVRCPVSAVQMVGLRLLMLSIQFAWWPVEGCSRTIVEHDHRWGSEYKDTRHTRLDELDPVCHPHHELHTRHGWALVAGTGKRPMVPPDDPAHPANQPRSTAPPRRGPSGPTTVDPRPGPPTTSTPPRPPADLLSTRAG